jgi:taurine dioxygenase
MVAIYGHNLGRNLAMAYETIQVKPLTPRIGAEISGINLNEPLGNQQFQEVHDALMEHSVIFFRDQPLEVEQHKAFGRRFGELHIHPGSPPPPGHPEILIIHADKDSKRVAGEKCARGRRRYPVRQHVRRL